MCGWMDGFRSEFLITSEGYVGTYTSEVTLDVCHTFVVFVSV